MMSRVDPLSRARGMIAQHMEWSIRFTLLSLCESRQSVGIFNLLFRRLSANIDNDVTDGYDFACMQSLRGLIRGS